MQDLMDKLIVALDVDTLDKAKEVLDALGEKVKLYKIGSQLFTAAGHKAIEMVANKGGKVFLDLKFHDIPNTVYSATCSCTSIACTFVPVENEAAISKVKESTVFPVFMMTVHTKGGAKMLAEAARAAKEKAEELKITRPFIVGVTRLTSDPDTGNTKEEVLSAARLAKDSGLDGVVCAATETKMIREVFGPDFIIVNPGIRAKSAKADDQKRTATAKEAIEAGASFIVVGRPILEASDPVKALTEL